MKSANVRITPFRQRVLDTFNQKSAAQNSKEIEQKLGEYDRITLYRTLKLFVSKGILHEIILPHDKKYALCKEACNDSGHHHEHFHFHCSDCEDTLCIESAVMPVNLDGFRIKKTELNVFGLCKNCQ
ncbi:MAG: Fur family transcriptional regulator [Flavobacteriales bacterium]